MRTEELVTSKSHVHFHSWDVNVGPAMWDDADIWDQITTELENDRVPVASELLRNYLEYISAELCHRLRARVEFRADGRMELGGLLPPAIGRLNDLLGKGKNAANSWNQHDIRDRLAGRNKALSEACKKTQVDDWQVNAAIHFNAWASLQKEDFAPLAAGFKQLIEAFRCPNCQAFLRLLRDGFADKSVVCDCGESSFNMTSK